MSLPPDPDPQETQEWLDALDSVLDREGVELSPDRPLDSASLGRVRLVRIEIGVEEALGRFRGSASRRGAAAIRVRESPE